MLLRDLCQGQPVPESSALEYKPGRREEDHHGSILELIQSTKMSQIPRNLLVTIFFQVRQDINKTAFTLYTPATISLSCTSDQNLRCVTSWEDRQIFFSPFFSTSTSAEVVTTELDGMCLEAFQMLLCL